MMSVLAGVCWSLKNSSNYLQMSVGICLCIHLGIYTDGRASANQLKISGVILLECLSGPWSVVISIRPALSAVSVDLDLKYSV
jgi:hypothetical protein